MIVLHVMSMTEPSCQLLNTFLKLEDKIDDALDNSTQCIINDEKIRISKFLLYNKNRNIGASC